MKSLLRFLGFITVLVGIAVALKGMLSAREQPPSEVFLEAADSPGEAPFTPSAAAPAPATAANLPPPPVPPPSGMGTPTVLGTTPALYGGTQDSANCNAEQIVSYLEANPDRARAWARPFGIEPGQIRTFVTGLTPVMLRADTRVTNYGLGGGRAIPSQTILQSGTSILVDTSGLPRVKCGSGNPLGEPRAVVRGADPSGRPPYRGNPWPGFSPSTVVVVGRAIPIGIIIIIIIDVNRGVIIIIRQPGTTIVDVVIDRLPPLVRPGDPVLITGRLFPPGTAVAIRYDVPNATVNADGGGNVNTTVPIPPDTSPGLHEVTAEGGGVRNLLRVYVLPPPRPA